IQLDSLDLVHMGGRVYDPVLGRFTSADPLVQSLEDLQALNRYSYCLNNPLSYVDPTGFSWWKSVQRAFHRAVNSVQKNLRQAAAHGVVGGVSAQVQGGNFLQGFASAAAAKSFSANIKDAIGGDGIGAISGRVVAAATLGGIASELTGGKFADGAMTGAFSRL